MARQVDLLEEIQATLDKSLQAYKEYIDGGRTFFLAKKIRLHNEALKELILSGAGILPATLQPDATALVSHISAWMQKWDAWKLELNPRDDDEFAFPNEHVFPKEAAARLADEYTRLKQVLHGE